MSVMVPAEGKAVGFNSIVRAVRSLSTEDAFAKLMAALPPDTQEMIARPPLPVSWIPAHHGTGVVRLSHQICFGGRDEGLMQAAKVALRADLSTMYKIFIRLSSPQYVIERSSKLWDTYNRNNGTLVSRQTSDTSAEVTYRGLADPFPALWAYQRGAIVGVLEATGMKHPRAVLVSGGGGEPNAVIEASWGA